MHNPNVEMRNAQPKFNGVFLRSNLPKENDGVYSINIHGFKSLAVQWKALYINGNNIINFDSYGVEHIPKENKRFIGNKNITNIYIIQAYHSIMCDTFVLDLLILF